MRLNMLPWLIPQDCLEYKTQIMQFSEYVCVWVRVCVAYTWEKCQALLEVLPLEAGQQLRPHS